MKHDELILRIAAVATIAITSAGCASEARLAAAERRIDVLQRHVVALEALLDDDDDDATDDVAAAQLATTTRPGRDARPASAPADATAAPTFPPTSRPARDVALARLDAQRAAHLANLAHADADAYYARDVVVPAGRDAPVTVLRCDPGPLRNTGRSLDVAIDGVGFLRVRTADHGIAYTRLGNLFIGKDGLLVLGPRGDVPLDPPITLPPETTNVTIADGGSVATFVKNTLVPSVIGRVQLARFADASRLAPAAADDHATFVETPASGPAILGHPGEPGFGTLRQSFLEGSNVSADAERAALRDVDRERDQLLGTSRP